MAKAKDTGDQNETKLSGVLHIIGNIVGITLIVILLPIMCINMTLIIKSYTRPNQVPSVFGIAPLIVMSGSMDDPVHHTIMIDDLILTRKVDPETLKEGDVIAFQPLGSTTVVTHRIIEVIPADETEPLRFTTKGDANNTADADKVRAPQVVGLFFQRFPGVGKTAMFLQQPIGMVVFVAVPLVLFLAYDVLRRHLYNRKRKGQLTPEQEELERLRAMLETGETLPPPPVPVEVPDDDFDDELPAMEPAPAEAPAPAPAPTAYPKFEGEDDLDDFGEDEA